jgi:Pyruvate/2-oxoacid:ferredoxin oxidoreductase delta subunit
VCVGRKVCNKQCPERASEEMAFEQIFELIDVPSHAVL